MNFWDSSAIVALLVGQPGSEEAGALRERDASMVVWWGTRIECAAAISRLVREKALNAAEAGRVQAQLASLSTAWGEVEPSTMVREQALELVSRHSLKAADALQLAAATVALGAIDSVGTAFVCLDRQLRAAARAEGMSIYPGAD